MTRKLSLSLLLAAGMLLIPAVVYAHVVVQPNQVGIGKTQVFSISVPTEKNVPTVGLRLMLPPGLQEVAPTVKAGWQITTKQSGSGDTVSVTEIDWTDGSIPVGLRDDFTFSAQVPAQVTTLQWKAYQTYADGNVVAWDQTPAGSDDATGNQGPLSTTQIMNDLEPPKNTTNEKIIGAYIVGGLGLVIGVLSLYKKGRS